MITFYITITGYLFTVYTVRILDVVRLLSVTDWFRVSVVNLTEDTKYWLQYDTDTTGRSAPLIRY